jgi:hypothetical protein
VLLQVSWQVAERTREFAYGIWKRQLPLVLHQSLGWSSDQGVPFLSWSSVMLATEHQ